MVCITSNFSSVVHANKCNHHRPSVSCSTLLAVVKNASIIMFKILFSKKQDLQMGRGLYFKSVSNSFPFNPFFLTALCDSYLVLIVITVSLNHCLKTVDTVLLTLCCSCVKKQ